MKNLFRILLLSTVIFTFTNCADKIEDAIEEVSFKVTVINNTADELTVFWKIEDGNFGEFGKVNPNGGTLDVTPVTINVDNLLEVRKADGTVVASENYNQPDNTDRTLTVD